MLTMVRNELHHPGVQGRGDRRRWSCRITTTFTQQGDGRCHPRRRGERAARRFSDKYLHVAVASVEPGTGALRGFYGGQDYLDSQINWAVTGGARPARRSSRSRWPPPSSRASPCRTPSRARLALLLQRGRHRPPGAQRGLQVTDGLGTDYGSSVSLVVGLEESINTVFADLTMSMEDGPESILSTTNDLGIPKWDKSKGGYNNIDNGPGPQPVSTGIALGSATISPGRHGQHLRVDERTPASRPRCTSSTR